MGFLAEVVRETRRAVDDPHYGLSVPERPSKPPESFRRAVEDDRERGALVVEFKKVSPGQPTPRLPTRTIREFLNRTQRAPVTAYSCLATTPRFEGSPAEVAELANESSRPVLFKDFIVDRRQVEVAARTGASAILLIARLAAEGLLSEPLSALADEAHRWGLEVLLEFHRRTELSEGSGVAADVYGVNTRDLDSLVIDRGEGERTLRDARAKGLRPLLGLSGVESAADALRFWNAGVDGILVGTAVARARDPAGFLQTLLRPVSGGSP